jgi:hypothetical protein
VSSSSLFRIAARALVSGLGLALGCGARTALDLESPAVDSGLDAPSSPADAALPPPPLLSHCALGPDGSSSPIAVANVGGSVSFVDERGVVTTPHVFTPAPGGMYRDYALVESRGAYVAAAVVDDGPTQGMTPSIVQVALIDGTGSLLFANTYRMPYESWGNQATLVGNASGLFVLTVTAGSFTLGVTFSAHAAKSFTDGYQAVGDPDEAGALLVNKNGNSSDAYYWLDTVRQTFTPTRFLSAGATSGAALYGTSLAYLTSSPPTLWLETATARAHVSRGNAWGPMAYPSLGTANAGPWALACWPSTTSTLATRFNLAGGPAAAPWVVSPPPGGSFLDPGPSSFDPACPSVDVEGDGFQVFSGSAGIQVYRAEEGSPWEPVGAPMGRISMANAAESGGTYLIGGSTVGGPPLLGPDGGAGVSLGPQMQVVRTSAHASVTLPPSDWTNQSYPAYAMTQDGGCIAYFEGGALTVADAREGAIHTTSLMADTSNDELSLGWSNVPGDGQIWTELGD